MIGLLLSLGLQASTLFSPARPVVPETPPPPRIAPLDAAATRQMSPHVWMLPGYPNIAIVVGTHAALVVDNGLGTPNGQVIAAEAQRLAPGKRLYLTTTHFHPEHAAGMAGLPADALLIRSRVQQDELLLDQGRMLQRFRVNNADALRDADYGQPAIVFETSLDLDLGGVHARLLWAGPAHTAGDTLVFVPEDGVLVSGDVVQNRTGPTFLAGGIGPVQWLHTLQAVAALQPQLVIPAHSEPGPGTALITAQQDFLQEIIDLTHAARARGLSLAQARTEVLAQLRKTHPDWNINPLTGEGVVHAWND